MKTILDLSCSEARTHLLKEESYFNFDLPHYFSFGSLLAKVSKYLGDSPLSDYFAEIPSDDGKPPKKHKPESCENVNYTFLVNKDGRFAWRPFELIHPSIYVSLVHTITNPDHWESIVTRFEQFAQVPNSTCLSIPVVSENDRSDKATAVLNWWESIEQKSLENSLTYEYILHADIADCYGSIYTHSVPWALHTKDFAKEKKFDSSLIGNSIDKHIREMSYGQTNGIPQGSVLMDFIAEMVLGFADLELAARIERLDIEDYEILRYRDDYRVFSNNPRSAELIAKNLSEVLVSLGLRLNADKTYASSSVVDESIKKDKWYWLQAKQGVNGIQNNLLLIHQLAKKHPNSGSLVKALTKLYSRIKPVKALRGDVRVLISIIVDVAYRSPRVYPISAAILSKLFTFLDKSDLDIIAGRIVDKFSRLPNTGQMQVWLQRALIKHDANRRFDDRLCEKVIDSNVRIWNSEWLSQELSNLISTHPIVDVETINRMDEIIATKEVQLFESKTPYP